MIMFERGNTYRQSGNIDDMEYDFTFTNITFNDVSPFNGEVLNPEYKPNVTIEERVDNLDNSDTDYIDYVLTINEDIDDYYTEGQLYEFKNLLDIVSFLEHLTLSKQWRGFDYDMIENSTELF